jgi:hypothetical protein
VISSKCRDDVPPELKQRIADALGLVMPPDPTSSSSTSSDDGGSTPRSV